MGQIYFFKRKAVKVGNKRNKFRTIDFRNKLIYCTFLFDSEKTRSFQILYFLFSYMLINFPILITDDAPAIYTFF